MNNPVILNNRYQLGERLGSGGMAVVYRAMDLMLEREVAIKVLRESYSDDPSFQERFRQEARAAANLSHPNIVTVHDFGLDRDRLFIVMELVPGTNLKSLSGKKSRFTINEATDLLIQACAGVGYAHRAGLVHCDIKPHNLLITPDKRLKITDFGIARALASIQPEEQSEVVWGSPLYFSPEQAAGSAPSPASDVYSLGVIYYELLTGRLPFIAESPAELARLHRETPPPPASKYNQEIPPDLELIVIKTLAKEPAARFRNADILGRVLADYERHRDIPQTQPTSNDSTASMTTPGQTALDIPEQLFTEPETKHPFNVIPYETIRTDDAKAVTNPLNIDWVTIGLGLLALLAVGGLVPLYLWVYFLYFQ